MITDRQAANEATNVLAMLVSLSRIHIHEQALMPSSLPPVSRQLKLPAVYVRRK